MPATTPVNNAQRRRRLKAQMPVNNPDANARCNGKCEVSSNNHHSLLRKPVTVARPQSIEPSSRKPLMETDRRGGWLVDCNKVQRGGNGHNFQFTIGGVLQRCRTAGASSARADT